MGISAFLDLKKLKETKPSGGNFNYPKGGFQGLVQVTDLKFDRTFVQGAAQGTPYFAMASQVISTNMPEDKQLAKGQTIDYYVPGDQGYFLGNIQSLIMGLLDVTKDEIDAMTTEDYERVVTGLLDGAKPGAIGEYLWCRVNAGKTKTGPRQGMPNAIANYTFPTEEQFTSAGITVKSEG